MEIRKGLIYGFAAYALWGLFPLYFPLLKPAEAGEILAHRVVWTLVAVGLLLAAARNWSWIRRMTRRQWLLLSVAAVVIAVNWVTYIIAVNSGHTIEASLGYFINPLVTVLIGVLLLGERLRAWQWTALGVGAVAVAVLTSDYGRPPWIALVLALSFGTYGLMKKRAAMPSAESLTVEAAVLALPALGLMAWTQAQGTAAFGHAGTGNVLLILTLGIVTAVPLMLFNASAQRLPLTSLGLLQYVAPVLQFLVGLLIQHEAMPPSRWIGFTLVWVALSILTWDALRTARQTRAGETVAAAAA
ncbi:EamA family transporter RarD [Actinocorallia populi]|uniref:EamA family transporter RarD n=1 Tax=Actinocorallia populi TaxID=2079200 RepID=UPI000D087FB3|nr:EamA family transporter RarD [Actinocorallia populi]